MDERQESTRPRPATGDDRRVVFVVILALLGAWISLTLTRFHLSAGASKSGVFSAVCDMTGGGCDQILQSSWAMLPRNIPLAFAGLVYFSALVLWYLVVGRPNRAGRSWYAPVFALHLLGAVISLLLIGVMIFQMGALCGWCALVHVINLVLLWLAWKLWPRGPRMADEPAWPPRRLGIVSLLLLLAAGVFWNQWLLNRYLQMQAGDVHGDTDLMRYLHLRESPKAIPIRADDPVQGSAAAPHTVVIFSDFQCPSCSEFATFFETKILPAHGDSLRLVYKQFPLDSDCNQHLPNTMHENACEAAHAAEAARELGGLQGFWKMHDLLFERKEDVKQGRWSELAASAGLDGAAIAERVERRAHLERIQEDVELGVALKLTGTPSVYIDGRPLTEWESPELWNAILSTPSAAPAAPAVAPVAAPAAR